MSFSTSFNLLPRLGLLALLGLPTLSAQAQTAPTWASVQRAGAANANSGSYGRKIAVAPDGSQFVTGNFEGVVTLGSVTLTVGPGAGDGNMFLAKYNANGTVAWATTLESSNGDVYSNVAADAAGNVYIVGYFADDLTLGNTTLTSAGNDAYIAKYNAQGVMQWVRQGGSEGAFVQGVVTDASGNVVIAGDFNDAVSFGGPTVAGEGIFITRFTSTGTVIQTNVVGTDGLVNDLALDAAGNAYVTGLFEQTATFGTTTLTSAGETDIYLCKVSPAGTALWARRDGGVFGDNGLSVAVDANGNPVVAGYYDEVDLGSDDDSGIYVARFTTQGSPVWARQVNPSGDGPYRANEVAYDNRGGYYVTGGFQGTVTFGSTTLNSVGESVFVARFDSPGNVLWAGQANGATTGDLSTGLGIATDNGGNAYVTGAVVGTVSFGSLPATTGELGAFVGKLNAGGTVAGTRAATAAQKLTVYPNPATGSATLTLPAGGGRLVLTDALGRTVREQLLPVVAGACPVSLEGLTPGLYQLRATLASGEVAHAALTVR